LKKLAKTMKKPGKEPKWRIWIWFKKILWN
jgi:hypothetical protein